MNEGPFNLHRKTLLAQLLKLEQEPRSAAWPAVAAAWKALAPDLKDWELQWATAGVARALALVDLPTARAAIALLDEPDLAAKTEHRVHLKIEASAEQLLVTDPERALALVKALPARYQDPVKAVAAARIFITDRGRALELYHELTDSPYHAAACLKQIATLDWQEALSLAEQFPAHEAKTDLMLKLAETIAPHDFSRAEAICDQLVAEQFRKDALRVLIPYTVAGTVEELFALFANPRYHPFRFQAFQVHENLLRAWCKVPLLTAPGETPTYQRFDGDETYWTTHQQITHLVEADPVTAFGMVRAVTRADWRHQIFEYAKAEYLQLR